MPRATLIVSGLAAAAAAVALLVITLSPGESEPFRASGPTLPAGVTIPTPNFQFATILPPRNGETQPTEIMIVAERIPYDPAAFHQYIQDSSAEWRWLLKYSETLSGNFSAITLDHSGAVLTQLIYPWHASVFQPFLDYAGVPLVLRETDLPWPTETPAPTPKPVATPATSITVKIRDTDVTLPPGAYLSGPPLGDCPPPAIALPDIRCTGKPYSIMGEGGRITFDEYGIIDYYITPEGEAEFRPLLDFLLGLEWEPLPSPDQ